MISFEKLFDIFFGNMENSMSKHILFQRKKKITSLRNMFLLIAT